MALIKCSECGHDVSDQAISCPSCGHPLTPIQETRQPSIEPPVSFQNTTGQTSSNPTNVWKIFSIFLILAIVAEHVIIAAILIPVFSQAKVAANKTGTLSNLKQVGTGLAMYLGDNDDLYPPKLGSMDELKSVLLPYTKTEAIFLTLNPNGGEFLMNKELQGLSATSINDPRNTIVIYDSNQWPQEGKCYGFADTHVKFSKTEEGYTFDPKK